MPPSKEATLARVRKNQQKSRARKQEYIASLERKLRDCEARKAPLDVESQSTLQRLERENTRLKSLLGAAGLPQIWIDAYLKLDSESSKNPEFSLQENMVSTLEIPSEASESSSMVNLVSTVPLESMPHSDEDFFDILVTPVAEASAPIALPQGTAPSDLSVPLIDFPAPTQNPLSLQMPSENENLHKSCTGGFCGEGCNCPASNDSTSNTTACTEAYQMVLQYNRKGLDMIEINIRLWSGFKPGKEGCGGCRVDNQILFDLLGYISI